LRPLFVLILIFGFVHSAVAQAPTSQSSHDRSHSGMTGMHAEQHALGTDALLDLIVEHSGSGTDLDPASTPVPMLMAQSGRWRLMLHGEMFLNELQQSGPRGGDKFFSTNWLMFTAQRNLGRGTLTFRSMLSLDPATVSNRRYPELFQEGETAFGRPIVDGQHPHDLFMELAAMYDYKLNDDTVLSFYGAPVGDPAMGPPAYPHRASASEDPIAPLGHHLQDSTHIASDVITAGIAYRNFRLEASGFHGREPDEDRWDIDSGRIDSWSTRITVNAGKNWSLQYSVAQLHSPEAIAPAEDLRRMTASVIYNRPIGRGNWASMLLWGRNQSLEDGNIGNSFLLESTLRFFDRNNVWTRIENVDRTNELLLGSVPVPTGFTERYFARVQAYTAGYDREIGRIPHLSTALGAQLTWYGVPQALQPEYGAHPVGGIAFLRLRLH